MRSLKSLLLTLTILAALGLPAHASAGYWSWGHNYMGYGVNEVVASGWNYWADQYLHKHSGGTIEHGFGDAPGCTRRTSGYDEWYGYPSDLGCGGYIFNFLIWQPGFGATSYLFVDSVA